MEYMCICQSLRPETYKFCQQNLKKAMDGCSTDAELRVTLLECNVYLQAYFLMKNQKDFTNAFIETKRRILHAHDHNALMKEGHVMLQAYLDAFTGAIDNNDDRLIRKALSYINAHFYERITLKTIAEMLYISENYLCRLFREKTGYRFCEYVNLLRVERAKKLIKEGNKTLEYISYLCGFSSQSHFSVTFKKYVKMPPGQYKTYVEQKKIDSLH